MSRRDGAGTANRNSRNATGTDASNDREPDRMMGDRLMNTSIAATALLAVGLIAPSVQAQVRSKGTAPPTRPTPRASSINQPVNATARPQSAASKTPTPAIDQKVFPANATLPAPVPLDQIQPTNIALPNEPIEPYLLTRDHGPFMVLAHTFRGPEADRFALALALELRREHGLQAFVCRFKDLPMRSKLFGTPPTAPPFVRQPDVGAPEKFRTYDEAGVMVGHARSVDEAEKLLKQVKKIHPKCLESMPTIFSWRKGQGLKRAIKTTNPFVPAEMLFPKKSDPLIKQMNAGPRSIYNCPGKFSLQIAEFSGRATFDRNDKKFQGTGILKSSPLATAAAEADELANALARDPEIQRTGYQPYVFHDRFSSKVTLGAFQAPNDPAAVQLRNKMLKMAVELNNRKVTDVMIVPADLIDVAKIQSE